MSDKWKKWVKEAKGDVLKDFVKHSDVSTETIQKYEGVLSEDVIELWKEYGYGSFYHGFFQIINPDEYIDLMKESIASHNHNAIPLFTTGMCDLIVWEEDFLRGCFYRNALMDNVSKTLEGFFFTLASKKITESRLCISPYYEAVEKYGQPEYGYGFGYVPLLPLGGKKSVDNLDKVEVKTHIQINAQLIGKIDY